MSLFPVSSDRSIMERQIVAHHPATTQEMNAYRYGYLPINIRQQNTPVPLPHTANREYSSMMGAQRRKEESQHVKKMREMRHHEDIRNQTWTRPTTESAFQIHRPNIHNFNRALNIRMPRWS